MFGQLPAVAALDLAQQAGDKPPDPPAGFGTLEVPPDPVDEPLERCGPAAITSLEAYPTTMMPPTAAQSTRNNHLTQSKLQL